MISNIFALEAFMQIPSHYLKVEVFTYIYIYENLAAILILQSAFQKSVGNIYKRLIPSFRRFVEVLLPDTFLAMYLLKFKIYIFLKVRTSVVRLYFRNRAILNYIYPQLKWMLYFELTIQQILIFLRLLEHIVNLWLSPPN